MYSGHTLVLVLTASLIFIPVIVTSGTSDHHEQAIVRKLATDIPGFISIDCGAAEDYTDADTGIFYQSDKEFIDTGTNMNLPSELLNSELYRQQLKNLRSFPQGKRNCYTLKPEQGRNNNYMIRAFFLYKNYDSKNQAPVFDLYLGVNKWDTVNSSTERWKEITHFSSTDNIHVCLVNTGFGIPFISTLELRLLNSSIYKIESGSLQTITRRAVGVSENFRYMEDTYDRIWNPLPLPDPQKFPGWYLVSTNSTIDTQSSNAAYNLPEKVLRTAGQTENSSTPLTFSWGPFDTTFEYYVYFHFAEIEYHADGQLRELNISFNGEYNPTEPIKLEYLKPLTLGPLNLPMKDTRLSFSIYATNESNLPPILNVFEIFMLKVLPNTSTVIEDVNAIMDIKEVYNVTKNWQGDPCVPSNYSWDGLNCSSDDNPPRIISLNLASSRLKGNITSSLSNLKSLESLDLSNNDLTGPVPEFLAQLPYLNTLKLAGNNLSGSIPRAIMKKVNDGSLHLSWTGNPNLCLSYSCEAKKKKTNIFFPVVVPLMVLFLLSCLGFLCLALKELRARENKRFREKHYQQGSCIPEFNREGSIKLQNQEFTCSDIQSITESFKNRIGGGGFGNVYLGTLKNGKKVAVKVLSPTSNQGSKEFQSEAQLLMRVHHKNLVSLIGYCNEGTNMALVYEYMAKGNLRQLLSGFNLAAGTEANVLNWQERLQIAKDAAQGLHYLHNECNPPIIHRDMKPSNILLNEVLQAKIADFGLSRDFKNESDTHVSTNPAGTCGYIDHKSYTTGQFSKKSDIYSFGVVLLELITGREAIIKDDPEVYIHISDWVRAQPENSDIQNIVDQTLPRDFSTNSVEKVVEIAMSCVRSPENERPDMSQVVDDLRNV